MQRTACHLPGLRMVFKTGIRDLNTHTHSRTHTNTETQKHTRTRILKILLPFASNSKAHLCSLASNTNTLQKFFFYSFFFIFGSDTASTTPAFKEPNRSLYVPFSRFLPLQKGPTAPKKLASLHPATTRKMTFAALQGVHLTVLFIYAEVGRVYGPCSSPSWAF